MLHWKVIERESTIYAFQRNGASIPTVQRNDTKKSDIPTQTFFFRGILSVAFLHSQLQKRDHVTVWTWEMQGRGKRQPNDHNLHTILSNHNQSGYSLPALIRSHTG